MLDASKGGSMNTKAVKEALNSIEAMTSNDYLMNHDRGGSSKKRILEFDFQNALLAQNKFITQQLETITKQIQSMHCG